MLHVHIFLGSLYLGVSACTKKSLLIFTTDLNNKLSFRCAEFTIDYMLCSQSTAQTGKQSSSPGKWAKRAREGSSQKLSTNLLLKAAGGTSESPKAV